MAVSPNVLARLDKQISAPLSALKLDRSAGLKYRALTSLTLFNAEVRDHATCRWTSSLVAGGPRTRPVLVQPEGYNLTLFRTSRITGGNCPENTIEEVWYGHRSSNLISMRSNFDYCLNSSRTCEMGYTCAIATITQRSMYEPRAGTRRGKPTCCFSSLQSSWHVAT